MWFRAGRDAVSIRRQTIVRFRGRSGLRYAVERRRCCRPNHQALAIVRHFGALLFAPFPGGVRDVARKQAVSNAHDALL
jgi:hypothetical protein